MEEMYRMEYLELAFFRLGVIIIMEKVKNQFLS